MQWEAISVEIGHTFAARGAGWMLPVGCALQLHGGHHFGSPLAFISSLAQGMSIVATPTKASTSLSSATHPILTPHPPMDSLPKSRPLLLVCKVHLSKPFSAYTPSLELALPNAAAPLPSSWTHLASQLNARSVVVMLGDKDVGKSTLALYLCNYVTSTGRSAYLLDTDPGQPDLSPAALLSLHRLDAPCALHGPAWARVRTSSLASYFFGSNTPKHNPARYLRLVSSLAQLAQKERMLRPGPLVVNTPGWVRGFGVQLQQEIIKAAQATTLVMLHATDAAPPLSSEETAVAPDAHTLHMAPLVRIQSTRLSATDTRELAFAAYLGVEHVAALPFAQVDVLLPPAVPASQLLRVLNSSIVGVTILEDEVPAQEAGRPMRVLTGEEALPPRCQLLALVQSVDALAMRIELITPLALPARRRVRLHLGDLYPTATLLARRAGPAAASAPYLVLASQLHDGSGAAETMTARPSLQRKKHRKS